MQVVYLTLFYIFAYIVRHTPKTVSHFLCNKLGAVACAVFRTQRRVIETNLDFAYDKTLDTAQKQAIVREVFRNPFFYLADLIRNLHTTKEELLRSVTFVNEHFLVDALAKHEKIIFVVAHYGNWELMPKAAAARFGIHITVVGRKLDSGVMNTILRNSRERFGVELIEKDGAMRTLIKRLNAYTTVGILVDQNTSDDEGILIDFFGKKARQTPVASILARRFNAVLIPVFISSADKEHFTITLREPIRSSQTDDVDGDILRCTQAQATVIETQIRENPGEWFWFHKRWKNQYEEIYKFTN